MGKNKFESGKNVKDRSKKCCTCGSHNCSNPKRNLNHNSTKVKFTIRMIRRQLTSRTK